MYGDPDKSTAYSLSGDIAISLSSSYSLFERRRAVRLLLESLEVEFEGQCELITPDTGYSSSRLCRISKELVMGEPVEFSNEGHEDASAPCVWIVAFNLVIPGWLPPSSTYGECESADAGTRYALYASAKFLNIDEGSNRSWISSCYAPFRSQTRVIAAPRCEILVNRFISTFVEDPSSSIMSPSSTIDYAVYAEKRKDVPNSSGIPFDVVSKLRAVISLPENVDTNNSSFPICLRLRTQDLPEAQCKRLRIDGFEVEVEQVEQYRSCPSLVYKALYPLPPASDQPPQSPLRMVHPMKTIYELGLAVLAPSCHTYTRSFSLLPNEKSGRFTLAGDGYVFAQDADPGHQSSWYSIRTQVPFDSEITRGVSTGDIARKLRQTGQSPLFVVNHRLHVALTCTYDVTEGPNPERATERLQFELPLRFAHMITPCASLPRAMTPSVLSYLSGHSPSPSLESLSSMSSLMDSVNPQASLPYAQPLPAYSQLFDLNGERKIDYSVPLPLYTPTAHCHPSSPSPITTTDLIQEI